MNWRSTAKIIGGGLALLGLIFVGFQLQNYSDELRQTDFTPQLIIACVLFSIAYAVSNFALALSYWFFLRAQGGTFSARQIIKLYGVSQLAKYVPGNVAHFAGRNLLGGTGVETHKQLAKATALEIIFLIVAASLFLPLLAERFALPISQFLMLGLALFGVLIATMVTVRVRGWLMVAPLYLYLLFFLVSSAIFLGLVVLLAFEPLGGGDYLFVIGAYIVAWLGGFLTPGAPAGVGSREVVLLFLLSDLIATPILIVAVLLARLISVVGDVLMYGFALSIDLREASTNAS